MALLSRIAGLFVLVPLLLLLVRGQLFTRSPLVIAGQVAGLVLMVWARRTFQPGQFAVAARPAGGTLLTTGPYRWLRHPMYAGALLLL